MNVCIINGGKEDEQATASIAITTNRREANKKKAHIIYHIYIISGVNVIRRYLYLYLYMFAKNKQINTYLLYCCVWTDECIEKIYML